MTIKFIVRLAIIAKDCLVIAVILLSLWMIAVTIAPVFGWNYGL